jgi:hypothetical protein
VRPPGAPTGDQKAHPRRAAAYLLLPRDPAKGALVAGGSSQGSGREAAQSLLGVLGVLQAPQLRRDALRDPDLLASCRDDGTIEDTDGSAAWERPEGPGVISLVSLSARAQVDVRLAARRPEQVARLRGEREEPT